MARTAHTPGRIAIVGGGAAGAIVAHALARTGVPVQVEVIERSGIVGPGLAYSTQDPRHVVNVPAGKLSAVADEPDHLLRWLAARGEDARPEAFPERRLYGEYVRELYAGAGAETVHATVVSLERGDELRLRLQLPDGSSQERSYDAAVLALGNVEAPPAIELQDDPHWFSSPWQPGALEPTSGEVLVIGTGLTAVDAALSITGGDPRARVVLTSRNGHLPFAHLPGPLRTPAPHDEFRTDCSSFDELVAQWRAHAARAEAAGFDWRDAVDGIRPITQQLWRALDPEDQRRFLRERRRWWEARRNRAAPQVGARLDELVASGRVHVVAGGVEAVGELARFERVISCTGPTSDVRRTTNPLLRQLFADGIASPDVHLLGIRTDADGAIVDASGTVDARLFTLGWLRRGELWETLAIPEIRQQAQVIAAQLTRPARSRG